MAFTQTRNQILLQAFKRVGINDPTGVQYQEASDLLNIEVNAVQIEAKRAFLWNTNENVYTLTASSIRKNNSKSYRCIKGHSTVSANEPGVGAESTVYWIEQAFSSGDTAWATSQTVTSINEVTLNNSVIDIDSLYIRSETSLDYPIELITYRDYASLDQKYLEIRPTHAYLSKDGVITTGNTTMTLRFNTHFSNTTDVILSREIINITEADANSDSLDAIKKSYKFLLSAVAHQLSYEYDPELSRILERQYEKERKVLIHQYRETDDRPVIDPYFPGLGFGGDRIYGR